VSSTVCCSGGRGEDEERKLCFGETAKLKNPWLKLQKNKPAGV